MNMRSSWIVSLLAALACHGTPNPSGLDDSGVPIEDQQAQSSSTSKPAKPRDRSVTIERGPGHVPHEVELDPRGEVALTLDQQGGLRLWPAIRSGDPQQISPYVLAMEEPWSMSVAQAPDGFVVATLDTNNAAQVVAVSQNPDGRSARLTPLFAIPPSDPLLEIHALDGGQRFLALGVDHRIRLYDRRGELVSVIDQRSFVPWQLRVVHPAPGQDDGVKLVAILASPPRVQSVELRGDTLTLVGEPRAVVLDRGPNRNDLALSPDGKTLAALRRRSGRGKEFSIELIELETDARKLIAGQSDTTIRPRMHFVDPERILLETGSNHGRGMWLDLRKAEPLAEPGDADPSSKLAKRLIKTKHDTIPLAASAEHKPEFFDSLFDPPWDHGERLFASVVAGLRVNVERGGTNKPNKLIIDPLDSDRHFAISLGPERTIDASALDQTGALVATSTGKQLRIARVGDAGTAIAEIEHGLADLSLLSFIDDRHVAQVSEKGQLRVIDWQAGQVVASTKLEHAWAIAAVAFHPSGSTGGVLGWRGTKPSEPVRLLAIDNGQLGSTTKLATEQRPQWLELLALGDAEASRLFGVPELDANKRIDEYTSDRTGRMYFTEKRPRTDLFVRESGKLRSIILPAGQGRELSVSPDGRLLAIVQFRERDDSFTQDHLLSVIDVHSGERLWTVGTPTRIPAPSWSGDGKRIVTSRVLVRDSATGDVIEDLSGLGVRIEERGDGEWARQRSE